MRKQDDKKIVMLGCYIGLACIALAPEAIGVLGGDGYEEGIACVLPIVLGIVCQYIYTHYVNIELHLKKTKYVSIGTVAAALVNMGLNCYFIPKYGFVAAAYTTFASYFLLMIGHFFITRMLLKIKLYNDGFLFISMLITTAAGTIVALTYSTTLLRYSLIFIGFVSFLIVYRQNVSDLVKKMHKHKKSVS